MTKKTESSTVTADTTDESKTPTLVAPEKAEQALEDATTGGVIQENKVKRVDEDGFEMVYVNGVKLALAYSLEWPMRFNVTENETTPKTTGLDVFDTEQEEKVLLSPNDVTITVADPSIVGWNFNDSMNAGYAKDGHGGVAFDLYAKQKVGETIVTVTYRGLPFKMKVVVEE